MAARVTPVSSASAAGVRPSGGASLVELHQELPAAAGQPVGLVVLLQGAIELAVQVEQRDAGGDRVQVQARA